MSEAIQYSTEKIGHSPEKIDDSEKIATDIEKIETQTEKTTEKIPEKIRYRGQRGDDKVRRRYNQNSLKNLKQFKNTIPQKPDSNNWIWIVVGIAITVVLAIIIWRIYVWWKEKQDKEE